MEAVSKHWFSYLNLAVALAIALVLCASARGDRLVPRIAGPLVLLLPPVQLVASVVMYCRKGIREKMGPWMLGAAGSLSLASIVFFWILVLKWFGVSVG